MFVYGDFYGGKNCVGLFYFINFALVRFLANLSRLTSSWQHFRSDGETIQRISQWCQFVFPFITVADILRLN